MDPVADAAVNEGGVGEIGEVKKDEIALDDVSPSARKLNSGDENQNPKLYDGFEKKVIKYYYQQVQITTEIYRYMMVFSAALMCLSHGSNDVANGISPLIVVMRQEQSHDNWSKLIGSIGITMGLLLFGRLVMESVGKEIVVLDFQKGFASQFSTAAAVTLGSSLGIPLSTTHCMIGSLAGIYFGAKLSPVKKIYWRKGG